MSEARRLLERLDETSTLRASPTMAPTSFSEDAPNLDRLFGDGSKIAEMEARIRSLDRRFVTHAEILRYLVPKVQQHDDGARHLAELHRQIDAQQRQLRWLVPTVIASAIGVVIVFVAWLVVFGALLTSSIVSGSLQ